MASPKVMSSPKMCLDCDLVTWLHTAHAKADGWVNLLWDSWNDIWRCPRCANKGRP